MVVWKNQISGDDEVGEKAKLIDSIESFSVPNFFVLTPEETGKMFNSTEPEPVLNSQVRKEFSDRIKKAYKDIGMSSEVRNASGKAKNLVGNQRDNQRVSVRVSVNGGHYEYKLNIGSSDIIEALKKVAASYYEKNDDNPAIIVQKMIEPEYSGSAIINYTQRHGLMETVEGSGISLEEGITAPYLYLVDRSGVQEKRRPEKHLKITRNPINGNNRRKKISPDRLPFEEEEVEEFFQELGGENLNVKFVYKRGSFHIIDAWPPEGRELEPGVDLGGVRVSRGEIDGVIGHEVKYTEETVPPGEYSNALISEKGGHSSRDAEKARKANKPAIFSYMNGLEHGKHVSFGVESVSERRKNDNEQGKKEGSNPFTSRKNSSGERKPGFPDDYKPGETAAEVLPVDPSGQRGIHLSPPFGEGYAVTDRAGRGTVNIAEENYLKCCADVFSFVGDKAVLDLREIPTEAREGVLDYLDAELKILVCSRPEEESLRNSVENGFDVYATDSGGVELLENMVKRAERQFIMNKLRDL